MGARGRALLLGGGSVSGVNSCPFVWARGDARCSLGSLCADGRPTGRNQAKMLGARILLLVLLFAVMRCCEARPIDRRALVSRHIVRLTQLDTEHPLQVGNGEFAYGMDITGMQSFVPFNTLSNWGWHTSPLPPGETPDEFKGQVWKTAGRDVTYPMPDPEHPALSEWLAANPHRVNLARLGLRIRTRDGRTATAADLTETLQTLDLWAGVVTSRFRVDGDWVTVKTSCHPREDLLAFVIESPLVQAGRLEVFLKAPGNNPLQFANFVGDQDHPSELKVVKRSDRALELVRHLDSDDTYYRLGWQTPLTAVESAREVRLVPAFGSKIVFTCGFSPTGATGPQVGATEVFAASRKAWPEFWKSGGAIDFSGTKDPRAHELERRVVLSQYLMKVNESGSLWPQESGLVNNGWYGKYHMEMVWWHAAHWALWNRWPVFDQSVAQYKKLLPIAVKRASDEGFDGARWPKCIGPNGVEWPHEIHALLLWQQPHPIYFAQLDYRAHPTRTTLEKWKAIVGDTADFLASLPVKDPVTGRFNLEPPMVLMSENTAAKVTRNPTFELAYWRFGLRAACDWYRRLGLAPKPQWLAVLKDLAPLPVEDGVYETYQGIPEMWSQYNFEHPGLTGVFGMLPGDGVDRATFSRTFDRVLQSWQFNRTWGWDFPMLAMAAARLGHVEKAVDLLTTKNPGFDFDARGLATGGPFPYFPSNGGLLYAVAMMAAGWDGAPHRHAPGFPKEWKVRVEQIGVAP